MTAEALLSPQETALFQALVKPGAVYLLMLRLDRPIAAREVADILGIHEQTAARYLRALACLNLVTRTSRKGGYVLLGSRKLVLGESPEPHIILGQEKNSGSSDPDQLPEPENNSQNPGPETGDRALLLGRGLDRFSEGSPSHFTKISQNRSITTTGINLINPLNKSVVVVKGENITKISQFEPSPEYADVWRELSAAGIGMNHRTRELVRLPHVTPGYVRAHRLKLAESGKGGPRWTGLLVTILERGEPAPELNPSGHLASCKCPDCHRHGIARSWG